MLRDGLAQRCLALAALLAGAAFAQNPPAARLRSAGEIAPGVPALPRLAGEGIVANAVNEALRQGDSAVRAALAACMNADASGQPAYWKRAITVPMRGRRYLAIVETDENFCGGAHGTRWTRPWAFDLRTGSFVDWRGLLPPGWVTETRHDQVWQDIEIDIVVSSALHQAYQRRFDRASHHLPAPVRPGCRRATSDANAFILWPAAREGGVTVQLAGLPSALSLCEIAVTIGVPGLREIGVDPGLVGDIAAAHARAVTSP